MRKLLTTLLLLAATVTFAFAQPGQRGERGPRGERGENLLEELDLSQEQQEQIKAIRMESRKEAQALRASGADERPDREKMMAIREKSGKAIDAVLTPAQREALAAKKEARKEAWKSVDKKGMKAELAAFQKEKVKPVLAAARAQFDQHLTVQDKTEIERLRTVFADKPGHKVKGKAKGKAGTVTPETRKELKEAHKAAMEAWKTEHAADIASLETLTGKYEAELGRVRDIIDPLTEGWKVEQREIMEKYIPEGAGHKGGAKARKKGKAPHRGGKGKSSNKGGVFLLMKG